MVQGVLLNVDSDSGCQGPSENYRTLSFVNIFANNCRDTASTADLTRSTSSVIGQNK